VDPGSEAGVTEVGVYPHLLYFTNAIAITLPVIPDLIRDPPHTRKQKKPEGFPSGSRNSGEKLALREQLLPRILPCT
jgi:hypothetical protein